MKIRIIMIIVAIISAFTLSACAIGEEGTTSKEQTGEKDHSGMDHSGMDHSAMDHSSSGEVPEGIKVSENPTYPVGSTAFIKHAHMEGMEGAEAKIVGAYETTAYIISYEPTNGGERVENHKWIIHEEILDAGEQPFEAGSEVKTNADHMEGMEGATVTIDSAEQTTVYMIDFTSTTGGEEIKNHKWVTESELSPTK
ncbi:hypothetical protein JOC85_000918 [Bacillus mesophilus]|uniref:YdhK family protein n=1 Tax=Bacillus mesophilus TaxID=1808955 RepID=A0A6M0QBQ4_9BACI|nr:YdhK family protein [Bacillus mesophilus]MBM7660151.1 hypothetical protein [Bacillus mesophilus]NEY73804.1 YdhK family protein [Bacillus mesophilus]